MNRVTRFRNSSRVPDGFQRRCYTIIVADASINVQITGLGSAARQDGQQRCQDQDLHA
jgi:hypothetical protein